MERIVRIGTRGSKLALWQAYFVQHQLEQIGVASELEIIKTKGDRIQHLSFDKIEGKGFFTKEIEEQLLQGNVDLAVHSMKDLPTTMPEGLVISAVSYRENPADWLIIKKEAVAEDQLLKLKPNAVVGTSSARRKAQLLDFRSDIELRDIRGNVPTRLRKLDEGEFDAIMLAAAGVTRLEIDVSNYHIIKFDPREFVPAPAQGVLAYQVNKDDTEIRRLLMRLHDRDVAQAVKIERKVLNLFEGGCHMPLGVYCRIDQMGNYHVWAAKANEWNAPLQRVQLSMSTAADLPERVLKAFNTPIES
jgi:hydroxymethylbilane synthase